MECIRTITLFCWSNINQFNRFMSSIVYSFINVFLFSLFKTCTIGSGISIWINMYQGLGKTLKWFISCYDWSNRRILESREFRLTIIWKNSSIGFPNCCISKSNCDNYVLQWWVEFYNELSWLFTKRFRAFIVYAENSQILLKISILLTFIYHITLNLLV